LALDPAMPFVVSGVADARTLLLIPLDENADTAGVAERLMRTALSRDLQSTVLDLSIAGSGSTGLVSNINALSAQFDLVVVRLPELASDISVGALRENRPVIFVATAGRVDRRRLSAAVDSLSRLSVPCAGVVLSRQAPRSLTAIA
jgi:Mrp family chromosome partitioning ATPase